MLLMMKKDLSSKNEDLGKLVFYHQELAAYQYLKTSEMRLVRIAND